MLCAFLATLALGACGSSLTDPGKDDVLRVRNGTGDEITVVVVEPDNTRTTLGLPSFTFKEVFVSYESGEVYTFETKWNDIDFSGSCTANAATVSSGAGEVEIYREQPSGTAVTVNCTSNWVGAP